jgi:ATP/maltotriose-dependent transcriptional regulator MalT
VTSGEAHDRLAAAQSALARCDWAAAYEHACTASRDRDGSDPVAVADALDTLAEAAWWVGRLDECIVARERAYAVYDEAGADRRAGQCAIWLYTHHCFKGKRAIATGWLRRARRALQGAAGSPEYGYLLLYESELAHGNGELDEAAALARTVVELGRQLRSPDLEAQALQAIGRVLIDDGRPAEGLAHLDEAMLFATEGRLLPYVTGKIYCSLVSACHDLGDIRRANEWTDAIGSWAERHPATIFPGLCRLHRADLLQWRGEWALAEAEAQRACGELESIFVPNAGAAFAGLGEIRRRRGDVGGAEEAFARAESLGARPAGGLARLRLSQRQAELGSAVIADALAEATSRLSRAWLLPVETELAIAVGDVERAADAAAELAATATCYESPLLLAESITARGRVQLAAGDPDACSTLRAAVRAWCELDAPYETATSRLLLGQAYRQVGDERAARTCFSDAETLFRRLGANSDVQAVMQLAEPSPLPCGLTAREGEVLRLVAAGSTNKQIAAELFLSDKTISRHLSNIFLKIGVRSRAAATAFAFEHHLMR